MRMELVNRARVNFLQVGREIKYSVRYQTLPPILILRESQEEKERQWLLVHEMALGFALLSVAMAQLLLDILLAVKA